MMTISYEMLTSAVRQEFQSIKFQIRSELRRARTRQQPTLQARHRTKADEHPDQRAPAANSLSPISDQLSFALLDKIKFCVHIAVFYRRAPSQMGRFETQWLGHPRTLLLLPTCPVVVKTDPYADRDRLGVP
jgi:hypothetical protein